MAIILCVDDNPVIQRMTTRLLARGRPTDESLCAASAEEAMQHARSQTLDLVLLDFDLPDGTGEEVLKMLKNEGVARVVMLTGHDDPLLAKRLKAAGADGYMTKPFEAEELFEVIDSLLKD